MITHLDKSASFTPRFTGYAHQDAVLNDSWNRRYYALFWEMGLGKTKTTIETAVKLFLTGEIDGVLVIAPKCAYLNWISEEVKKHMPDGINYRLAAYSCYSTAPMRRAVEDVMVAKDDVLDILAINIEAIATNKGFMCATMFARSHYTMCVVDESSKIKSPNAKRTKAAQLLGRECDYRRILSGTPITKNLLDLWTQLEFLRPGLSKHRSYFSFRNYYAIIVNIQAGPRVFPKITGFRNVEELTQQMVEYSDRRLKSECLDLPEKIFETIFVEPTPEQARVYNALRTAALAEFEQGTVSSTSALTTIMRLHQVNCGHVKLDEGTVQEIPTNRVTTLLDLVEDIDGKVIIWCRFRQDIINVSKAIRAEYGDMSFVTYYGGTTSLERVEGVKRFKSDPRCRFFIANPASAGMSITLVEATTAIYYSLSYSLEEWLQSQDRNHRIGQTKSTTYLTLAIDHTVDMKIIEALQLKQDLASSVLDNFRQMLQVT